MKKNNSKGFFLGSIPLLLTSTILLSNYHDSAQVLLADKFDKSFQKTLDQERQDLKIPGVSVAVILPDGSKWLGVSGKSSENEEVNPKMLFGLGSVTMTYTAALILKLEEEGALSLDDQIGKWISGLKQIDENITIRQLLNHTSGLSRFQEKPEFLGVIFAQPEKIWTSQEILETFQGDPECPPGSCWGESAMDDILLGIIVEKITGLSISSQFQKNFFTPLKLEQTFLYPEQRYPVERMAHFWWDNYGLSESVDVLANDTTELPLAGLFSALWTAGAMHSTAEDLACFIKDLFEGKILEKDALEKMLMPGPEIDPNTSYGFNVIIEQINGQAAYWHTGGIGYSSIYYYLPNEKLSIAVLSNCMIDLKTIAIALYNIYKEH